MSPDIQPTEVDVPATTAVRYEGSSTMDPEAIKNAMGRAFQALQHGADALGVTFAGPPRAIYHTYEPDRIRWTLAFPIAAAPEGATEAGDVSVGDMPGGRALRFTHTGPYDDLPGTYGEITSWMIEQGHMASEADWALFTPMWEEYVDDPESTPPETLRTFVYVPLPA